ncbi:gamma-glutamyltransferase [Leptospira sp. 96542]|nr:gamma-glutamyltransferase [Leptospira sp. 96542]
MKSLLLTGFLFQIFLLAGCESLPSFLNQITETNKKEKLLQISGATEKRIRYEIVGKEFVVATDHPLASEAGVTVWKEGGNVVDVFAAASFAISVLRPQSTGLLGGGFAVLSLQQGRVKKAYDFRERAPNKASASYYLNEDGTVIPNKTIRGPYSAGVPGNIQGILQIHKKYGKLPLEKVINPAFVYAKKGFSVYGDLAKAIQTAWPHSDQDMKQIFGKENRPLREGELLVQEDLAKTLERIIQNLEGEILNGETKNKIVEYYKSNDEFITSLDFSNYRVDELDPLTNTIFGKTILTMPPPSSAVHLITIGNIYDELKRKKTFPKGEVGEIIRLTESMRVGYRDRAILGGDPKFTDIPVSKLISSNYAKSEASEIEKKVVSGAWPNLPEEPLRKESYNTTHISVLDKEGNAVSSTQSINGSFGAQVVVPGTGLVLNNTMDDFALAPGVPNLYGLVGSEANAVAPGKTPLSSMSPSILLDEKGKPFLVIGAPGGSHIPTAILNTLYHYLELKQPLYESVSYPRYHHQYAPDILFMDPELKEVFPSGELPFYKVKYSRHWAKSFVVAREGDNLIGVSDPKGEGIPLGF